jgi:CheY-like chemotaxis protein
MKEKQLNILLIEDDIIEVMKMNRTLRSFKIKHKYTEAQNAELALKILKNKDNYPDIILLDLNMPKITGIDFLRIIKNNENLRHIPVIILTTSNNKKDLLECFKLGVSGYVLKPLKFENYVIKIKRILNYWSINELIEI